MSRPIRIGQINDQLWKYYHTANFRFAALHKGDQFLNLRSRLVLSASAKELETRQLLRTSSLLVEEVTLKAPQASEVLAILESGNLQVGSKVIKLGAGYQKNLPLALRTCEVPESSDVWPCYCASWSTGHQGPDQQLWNELMASVDRELKLATPYHEDWTELLQEFFGTINQGCELILPFYEGMIEKCELGYSVDGKSASLFVQVKMLEEVNHTPYEIVYQWKKNEADRSKERAVIKLGEPVKVEHGVKIFTQKIPLSAGIRSAVAHLRNSIEIIATVQAMIQEKPTRPHKLLEILGPFYSREKFEQALAGKLGNERFEWAICSLLSMCGASPVSLPRVWHLDELRVNGKTKGGSDCIALFNGQVLVVACTTGVSKDDVEKINNVVTELRKLQVQQISIQPVLCLTESASSDLVQGAARSGIVILDGDDIAEIYASVLLSQGDRSLSGYLSTVTATYDSAFGANYS